MLIFSGWRPPEVESSSDAVTSTTSTVDMVALASTPRVVDNWLSNSSAMSEDESRTLSAKESTSASATVAVDSSRKLVCSLLWCLLPRRRLGHDRAKATPVVGIPLPKPTASTKLWCVPPPVARLFSWQISALPTSVQIMMMLI